MQSLPYDEGQSKVNDTIPKRRVNYASNYNKVDIICDERVLHCYGNMLIVTSRSFLNIKIVHSHVLLLSLAQNDNICISNELSQTNIVNTKIINDLIFLQFRLTLIGLLSIEPEICLLPPTYHSNIQLSTLRCPLTGEQKSSHANAVIVCRRLSNNPIAGGNQPTSPTPPPRPVTRRRRKWPKNACFNKSEIAY